MYGARSQAAGATDVSAAHLAPLANTPVPRQCRVRGPISRVSGLRQAERRPVGGRNGVTGFYAKPISDIDAGSGRSGGAEAVSGRCPLILVAGHQSTDVREAPPAERKGPLTCGGAKGTRTPNPLLAKSPKGFHQRAIEHAEGRCGVRDDAIFVPHCSTPLGYSRVQPRRRRGPRPGPLLRLGLAPARSHAPHHAISRSGPGHRSRVRAPSLGMAGRVRRCPDWMSRATARRCGGRVTADVSLLAYRVGEPWGLEPTTYGANQDGRA